jgi:hypothetical protein
MFHQVQRAIEPAFSLGETLGQWNDIAQALAENPRQRMNQTERYFEWR